MIIHNNRVFIQAYLPLVVACVIGNKFYNGSYEIFFAYYSEFMKIDKNNIQEYIDRVREGHINHKYTGEFFMCCGEIDDLKTTIYTNSYNEKEVYFNSPRYKGSHNGDFEGIDKFFKK